MFVYIYKRHKSANCTCYEYCHFVIDLHVLFYMCLIIILNLLVYKYTGHLLA